MLIINKKFSNLLNGYKRAVELDQKLKTEWKSKFEPELLGKMQGKETEQEKDYQEKLHKWLEDEKIGIAQWEEAEKTRFTEWESNEVVRKLKHSVECSRYVQQNQPEIDKQKQKRNLLMIGWISSSIAFVFFLLLIIPISRISFLSGLGVSAITMIALGCSIGTFIGFMVLSFKKTQHYPGYVPSPKPQPTRRIPLSKPIAPVNVEDMMKRYTCPNVLSSWMEEIQYKDEGKEYFRKFSQDNPEAANGIPGELALLGDHYAQDFSSNTGIYIPGLKTNLQGDMDGISISHKGIWILESKYLIGKVIFRDGLWKQFVYTRHNGQRYLDGWEEKKFDKSFKPDDQLSKALDKIKAILSKFLQDNPWVTKAINGVVVFTHDDVELDISNCSVPYINRIYLFDLYRNSSDIPELTFEKRLEIADILLLKNREFEKLEVSAVQVAEEIYSCSIKSLEKLVQNFSIS